MEDNNEMELKQLISNLKNELIESIKASEQNLKSHVDNKLKAIFKKIDANKTAINNATKIAEQALNTAKRNEETIQTLQEELEAQNTSNNELKLRIDDFDQLTSVQSVRIKVLETRLEDQTNRSSRKSLVISGLPERKDEITWSDTTDILCDKLSEITRLGANDIYDMIERAHRGRPNKRKNGKRYIFVGFHDWNDSELMKQKFLKYGKGSNIYIDQKYGPDTTWRRNQALLKRKQLKADGLISNGFISYPAKLMVKYNRNDHKYQLYADFSAIKAPLPVTPIGF